MHEQFRINVTLFIVNETFYFKCKDNITIMDPEISLSVYKIAPCYPPTYFYFNNILPGGHIRFPIQIVCIFRATSPRHEEYEVFNAFCVRSGRLSCDAYEYHGTTFSLSLLYEVIYAVICYSKTSE